MQLSNLVFDQEETFNVNIISLLIDQIPKNLITLLKYFDSHPKQLIRQGLNT